MKTIFITLISLIVLGCKNNSNPTDKSIKLDTIKKLSVNKKSILSNNVKENIDSIIYTDKDTIVISILKSNEKDLMFYAKINNSKFTGKANLVLEESDGKYYVPEGTPILDEKSNEEFICDSTYSYESNNISFVFAVESKTAKRLSFIINNSSIKNISDNFLVLYREKPSSAKSSR